VLAAARTFDLARRVLGDQLIDQVVSDIDSPAAHEVWWIAQTS
jgi:hypothetical protein